ncbi:hypothetical protein [Carboxylicivirga sp. RSCT41]|uniref:hypothetical protein n=1 Tax=Carboxylicivirga agarovorans TaxID=3417570 RepID=UPI003D3258A2
MKENELIWVKLDDGNLIIHESDKVEEISVFTYKGECVYSQDYPCNECITGLPETEELFVVIKRLFGKVNTLKLVF